jgi:hypothetical protein
LVPDGAQIDIKFVKKLYSAIFLGTLPFNRKEENMISLVTKRVKTLEK